MVCNKTVHYTEAAAAQRHVQEAPEACAGSTVPRTPARPPPGLHDHFLMAGIGGSKLAKVVYGCDVGGIM